MELEFLAPIQVMTVYPYPVNNDERFSVSSLTSRNKFAQNRRKKREFLCRHCKGAEKLTFDGLISHLKAKHDIDTPGDEDVHRLTVFSRIETS